MSAGLDERAVRSANATVPFLARFTGQGVVPGDGNPLIVKCKVRVSLPHSFVATRLIVKFPGSVGAPVMFPLVVFKDKPWGRAPALYLSGLFFALCRREHRTPVAKVTLS